MHTPRIVLPGARRLAHYHLERAMALSDELLAIFGELLLVEERVAEGGVGGRPVPEAAHEFTNGAAFLLAADVPQGDVDGRQRVGDDAGIGAVVDLAPDVGMDALGVVRVHPLDGGQDVVPDGSDHGPGEELARDAEARYSLVGFDLYKDEASTFYGFPDAGEVDLVAVQLT
jgi:hypothetical protein